MGHGSHDIRPGERAGAPTAVGVLVAMYCVEAAVLLASMILYKHGDRPWALLLTGRHGIPFVASVVIVASASAYAIYRFRRVGAAPRRQLWMTVWMNAVSVAILIVTGEGAIRLWARQTPRGLAAGSTLLLPYSWDAVVARNRQLLEDAEAVGYFFVPDPYLGWTVGPGRRSRDGLYAASVEGIRSARPGVSYAGTIPAQRVALVGDSYAFGLEVPFEESWGHRLEQDLGAGVQVLNFGVDAYGVDQAYLRYARDVRSWRPDVVVFGFIDHDLYRSLAVYAFISFPEWGWPLAKPRFVLSQGKPRLLGKRVPGPREIIEHRSVEELPFITYDPGYDPHQWRWQPMHHSYLARFLVSRFPRYGERPPDATDEAVAALNLAILGAFTALAREDGAVPLVVYFPSRGDFQRDDRGTSRAVIGSLRGRGVPLEDLTPCLERVGSAERFLEGRPHYSSRANAAVATCLAGPVRRLLGDRARQPRS
jgi:hypothetical protein